MTPDPPTAGLRKFITVDPDPSSRKRKTVAHACGDCKRKKRRCEHGSNSSSNQRPVTSSPQSLAGPSRPTQAARSSGQGTPASLLDGDNGNAEVDSPVLRFIGDLNPEAELLSATGGPQRKSRDCVGIWQLETPSNADEPNVGASFSPGSLCRQFPNFTQQLFIPIMQQQCFQMLPPTACFDAIEAYYFAHVHSILPAVDEIAYHSAPLGGASRIMQSQAICLAAHTNHAVRSELRLPDSEGPLSPTVFGQRIIGAMRFTLEMALVSDKTVLIRCLVIMSLFAYGRESLELTCQFFARAVHIAYTVGLHLGHGKTSMETRLDALFCFLWSMDRLHASIQGRPVLMHDHDMSATPKARSLRLSPLLRLTTEIALLLDHVIALYRPNASRSEIPDVEFPPFERLLCSSGATNAPAHHIATIELFYHAVAVLSCRPNPEPSSPPMVHNSRPTLSALQIVAIMDDESSEQLVNTPYLPYAVSLSLRTAYRQLRSSTVPLYQMRARELISRNRQHLVQLSDLYWSASVMADLAGKILKESPGETREAASSANDTAQGRQMGNSSPQNICCTSLIQSQDNQSLQPIQSGQIPVGSDVQDLSTHQHQNGIEWEWDDLDALFNDYLDPSIPSFRYDM